ncbi:50S ribosomal protein L10 [Candidatus Parcubacteria bacterium]|nr:50S ribosomal protein L10 [Candidatus Parcubacteria bacterium]
MAITREKKGEIVDKLTTAFKGAASVVFVNFKGLSVGNTTEMRRTLKNQGVSYTVAKKSLTKKALEGEKFEGEAPTLPGELSLAWGADMVAPAREVYGFMKKFPENLKILGGIFQGRYVLAGEVEEMAKIPTREVLRGKFVNIINSPIQRFAIALNEIAKKKA